MLRIAIRLRWATLNGPMPSSLPLLRIAIRLRWATLFTEIPISHYGLRIAIRLRWDTLGVISPNFAKSCGLLSG